MRIYVDLDTLNVIQTPGVNTPVKMLEFKRGDAAILEVRFFRDGSTPVLIPAGSALVFTLKAAGDFAGSALVFADTWEAPDDPDTEFYTAEPNFNTTELNTAVGVATYIDTIGELSWTLALKQTSTKTVTCRIHNDVYKGDEGDPESADPPFPPPGSILTDDDIGVTIPALAHSHAAADTTSGVFATARLGTGTANGSKVLFGDGTWGDAPEGGGGGGGAAAPAIDATRIARPIATPSVDHLFNAITFFKGQWYAAGKNANLSNWAVIYRSPDLLNWTLIHNPTFSNGGDFFRAIAASDGLIVAIAENGKSHYSTDGSTWNVATAISSGAAKLAYGNGLFIAVQTANQTVFTTTDGATWTNISSDINADLAGTLGTDLFIYGLGWTDDMWILVGEDGLVATSPDGDTWTPRTSGTTHVLYAVGGKAGLKIAVGGDSGNSKVLTSTDGVTWAERTTGTADPRTVVARIGEQWVIGGENSSLLISDDDGVTWSAISLPASSNADIQSIAASADSLHLVATRASTGGAVLLALGAMQLRPLSASASLNFADLTAGSEETLTITVPGASPLGTPAVTLGWSAALDAGLVIAQVWVSAVNTVSVRARNASGGNVNAAATTCRGAVLPL